MQKIISFFKSLFFIVLYFFITICLYGIFRNDVNSTNNLIANFSTIFVDILILFIFIIIFKNKLIPDFYTFKNNYKKYLKDNIKWWVLGLFLMLISNIVISMLVGTLATNEEMNRKILFTLPLSSIISMVIVAPIIEELITRKTFKDVFNNQYIYITISGLIFGSLHLLSSQSLIELLYVIPYGILGGAFAKMYYDTDNIWVNISFHSIHNLVAILIIFTGV